MGGAIWLGQNKQSMGSRLAQRNRRLLQAMPNTFLSLVPTTENLAKAE